MDLERSKFKMFEEAQLMSVKESIEKVISNRNYSITLVIVWTRLGSYKLYTLPEQKALIAVHFFSVAVFGCGIYVYQKRIENLKTEASE